MCTYLFGVCLCVQMIKDSSSKSVCMRKDADEPHVHTTAFGPWEGDRWAEINAASFKAQLQPCASSDSISPGLATLRRLVKSWQSSRSLVSWSLKARFLFISTWTLWIHTFSARTTHIWTQQDITLWPGQVSNLNRQNKIEQNLHLI